MTTRGRWYITQHAVERYQHARRWPDDDEHFERAEDELIELSAHAELKATDRRGRQLWRSRRTHGGLRWVVAPAPRVEGSLPQVVWVGQGSPPSDHWDP